MDGPPYLSAPFLERDGHKVQRMKRLHTLLFSTLLIGGTFAQKHVYDDLLVLYVDENYEKCIMKAEGYTLKDDTKRDALPFLYISMCMFEMSKLEKYTEDYPKASVDAMKYAVKFRKKDKTNEYFRNYEDYWTELNTMAQESGENHLDDPKGLSKARQTFTYMTQYNPENPGAWLMLAVAQYRNNLAKEGDLSVKEFQKAYAAVPDLTRLPADQKKLLRTSLIRYSSHLVEKGNRSTAREFINMGKDLFMDSPDFKLQYEELN